MSMVFGQISRCDYICNNDETCKSGKCVLTYCSDTIACYKYCLNCNQQETCYETGNFCSYGINGSNRTSNTTSIMFVFAISILLVIL